MNKTNPIILNEYAELQIKIRTLEAEAELIKPLVLQYCLENQDEEHIVDGGQITLSVRRQWTYPAEVVALEVTVKEKKKEAEAKGDATYIEKPFVVFTQDK